MNTKRPKKGRPLQGEEKRIRTSFTLTPSQLGWLKKRAKLLKTTKSELLSQLISESKYTDEKMPNVISARFPISRQTIFQFCMKYRIKKIALFGSILREDFNKDSDIDLLVEFEESEMHSYFTIVKMENELSQLLNNRKVDIRTYSELSKYFKEQVNEEAEVLYAA